MNYTELKTEVADYLHRSDLADKIPTFVALAEAALFRELAIESLATTDTGTAYDGAADLPYDLDSLTKITVTQGLATVTLDYGVHYVIEGSQITFLDDTGDFTIHYKAKLTPLSSSVASNWLLSNAFDLYLYASALEGAKYVKDQAEIAALTPQVGNMLAAVKSKITRSTLPASGSLRITPSRMSWWKR